MIRSRLWCPCRQAITRSKPKPATYGVVTIPVVVEAGKLTMVNLQRGENPVVDSVAKSNAVLLGGYRIVGWRAKSSAWPDSQ